MDGATRTRIVLFPLIVFALIIADQISKQFALASGAYVLNEGISWGLLKSVANINVLMVGVATLALLLFIYLLAFRADEFHSYTGLLLLIAGTAGNLIDRLTIGAVVDFIAIGSFPVFNFADAYLTLGVFIIIIATLIAERRAKDAGLRS